MDVLVFKTSVTNKTEIEQLRPCLNPFGKWNFDLDDGDGILRIESCESHTANVISMMQMHGFSCEELE